MCKTPNVQVAPSTNSRAKAPRAQDLRGRDHRFKLPAHPEINCNLILQGHRIRNNEKPTATCSTWIKISPPDVFIVADFRLFHSCMTVYLVHDHSKSQEIDLQWKKVFLRKQLFTVFADLNYYFNKLLVFLPGWSNMRVQWSSIWSGSLCSASTYNAGLFNKHFKTLKSYFSKLEFF